MNKKYVIFLYTIMTILGAVGSAQSAPTYIDFSYVDEYTPYPPRIQRIGEATFSYNLYTNPDGFASIGGGAFNSYGERKEFIEFDNPVFLSSIDVSEMSSSYFGPHPAPENLIFEMYDSNDALLNTVSQTLTSSLQTVSFNQSNVAKLLFDFTDGVPWNYGDDREHAWYFIDNLSYAVESSPVPVPGTALLFFSGLLAIAGLRKKLKTH